MGQREFVRYEHHGRIVSVYIEQKGEHENHCLCHTCRRFLPTLRDQSCPIANAVYALDVLVGIVTPVWECPNYDPCEQE